MSKLTINDFMGGLSAGLGTIDSGISAYNKMSELPENNYLELIDKINSTSRNYSSYNDILNNFDSSILNTHYDVNNILGMNGRDAAINIVGETIGQGLQGATLWGAFGPIGAGVGAAVGATVGALTSGLGYWSRKNKALKEALRLETAAKAANFNTTNKFQNAAKNINLNMRNNYLLNNFALGGEINPQFSNGVRFIDEGGSHEQNPNGGVPLGIAQDGLPNLVEEGEVIWNDYVFSKRLQVPESDKESLGLKKGKKISYAEAADKIQKESEERPNDPISKKGLEINMAKLQESLELLKLKRQLQDAIKQFNSLPQELLNLILNQAILNQYAQLQQANEELAAYEEAMQLQMALELMMLNNPYVQQLMALGGKLFNKGCHLFPWGGDTMDKPLEYQQYILNHPDATKADWEEYYNVAAEDYLRNYGLRGTKTGPNRTWDMLTEEEKEQWGDEDTYKEGMFETYGEDFVGSALDTESVPAEKWHKLKTYPGSIDSNNRNNMGAAMALRAAPVLGSLLDAFRESVRKPNYSHIDVAQLYATSFPRISAGTIGLRMPYNPIDINYLVNMLNNQSIGSRRMLSEMGIPGILNAILANSYAGQAALGKTMIDAQQANNLNLLLANTFNRDVASTNITNALNAANANQNAYLNTIPTIGRLADMRIDAEQALLDRQTTSRTNAYNQIGNLGTDLLQRGLLETALKNNNVSYTQDLKDLADNLIHVNIDSNKKFGGNLKTKKKGVKHG